MGLQGGYSTGSGGSSGSSSQKTDLSTSGSSTPTPTEGWTDTDSILRGILGNTGLNSGQQGALDSAAKTMNDNKAGASIDYANSVLGRYVDNNHPAYQVSDPTKVGTSDVGANQGAAFMAPYEQGYTDDVVNSTIGDLTKAYNKNINQDKMNAAAGGAFGGGRQGVAEANTTDDFLRNLVSADSNLRSQGFNTAATLGQGDASRDLQAGTTNAANKLSASQANAANALNADEFNVGAKQANDAQSLGAIDRFVNNNVTNNNMANANAGNVYGMSGGGLSNLFNYLNSQVPGFGSKTASGTSGSLSGANSETHSSDSKGLSIGGK